MKKYNIYFHNVADNINKDNFKFEYECSVSANNEEEAKKLAIALFQTSNKNIKIDDYVVGLNNQ